MIEKKVAKLNQFQVNCLYRLLNVIYGCNENLTIFDVHLGKEESWLELCSEPSGAVFWIHDDSAEIILGIVDGTYEWQAYENDLDALTDAFIAEVDKRLKDFN